MSDERPSGSTPRVDAGDVARRAFGTVRRGFDPQEVRAYLELVAGALEHAVRREQELLAQVQEAEERARHPVIDESVLTSSLGQRSAAVLRGAHEEAARILSQAEEAAAGMVRDAQHQATEVQVNAESSAAERIAEAELEANSLRQQAHEDASAVVETARAEGDALVERAREHGRSMLDQAQEARRRVLADMAHRRRLVTEQIELFRAARDEIAGSVIGVRRSLDRIVEDLSHAEDAARAAASGPARSPTIDVPESVLVEEGERAIAALGEIGGGEDLLAPPSSPEGASGAEVPAGPDEERGSHAELGEHRAMLRFDDIATVVDRPEGAVGRPIDAGAEQPVAATAPGNATVHDWQEDPGVFVESHADQPVPVGPDAADPAVGGSDVDGLFARLRARHAADPAGAEPDEVDAVPEDRPSSTDGDPGGGEPPAAAEDDAEAAGSETGDVGGGTAETGDEGADEEGAGSSPDAELFARRAEMLDPITTTLARRLKRALQDDQNRLLDRLRQGTGEWHDGLLVDEASQRDLYAKASAAPVRDAVAAGATFAREIVGGRRPKAAGPDEHVVSTVSDELASTVVTLLRRRLETGEVPDAAERIGAAYREWRGERIERIAEDSAIEAFSRGVLAGAGRRSIRWSRSEVGPGCADCEDNGLAGGVTPGEEFPTGHRHPPAHAGCRCLVVPTPS